MNSTPIGLLLAIVSASLSAACRVASRSLCTALGGTDALVQAAVRIRCVIDPPDKSRLLCFTRSDVARCVAPLANLRRIALSEAAQSACCSLAIDCQQLSAAVAMCQHPPPDLLAFAPMTNSANPIARTKICFLHGEPRVFRAQAYAARRDHINT